MTSRAIDDFIFFCDLSFDYGLIDIETYHFRQISLYDLVDVDKNVIADFIPNYIIEEFYKGQENERSNEEGKLFEGQIGKSETSNDSNNNALYLFKTTTKGKHCKWVFHELDADPRPSVPHGHGVEFGHYKLDPYCRFIYNVKNGLDKWVDKEDKKYIKALWNDNEFRRWTLWSIKEFMNSGHVGRNYNWSRIRGIVNPTKLPRKRK